MNLRAKLLEARGTVRLYGTTPPREGSTGEVVMNAAAKLVERVQRLPIDGFVIYDIQDESARTSEPRPFPFVRTIDPRVYSKLLAARTGTPAICYKSIGLMSESGWRAWLDETDRDFGIEYLSIVGRPTSRGGPYPLSLEQAIRIAAAHQRNYLIGGVALPERHRDGSPESGRMIAKAADGCSFFVSQTVYHAATTVKMLTDYARDCAEAGVAPRRVILTFAPVGRPKTMTFVKWLGVAMPAETERAILDAPSPLSKSIEICRANLERILDQDYVRRIPLGINVESVSINREEIDASIDLFHALESLLPEDAPASR
ncbi:MAG: hypothetical protein HYU77_13115 [Betaproteobacteria bacterium]|nr:hypothetical protein [Betaproteobacteria bacterium]